MSKGDKPRPYNREKFDKNWETIFNHKPKEDDEETLSNVRGDENKRGRRKRK